MRSESVVFRREVQPSIDRKKPEANLSDFLFLVKFFLHHIIQSLIVFSEHEKRSEQK